MKTTLINSDTHSPVLKVKDLSVDISEIPIIQNINFEMNKGDTLAVVGPNGAGKSTLVKGILGLDLKTRGEILFWNKKFASQRKRVAFVPQKSEVDWDFPLTVSDVVLQGRYPHLGFFKSPALRDYQIVQESLNQVDLWNLRARSISQLSQGQKQRMFLARALAQEAELFMMDEPTAGLDAKSEDQFFGIVKMLSQQKKTFLVVHHNLYSVKKNFSKVLLLNVCQFGFDAPENLLKNEILEEAFQRGS